MTNVTHKGRPNSSLFGPALRRLSASVSPLVRAQIVEALIAELDRHFQQYAVSTLQEKVESVVDREVPQRVERILDSELPQRVEAIIERELPARVEAIIERELPARVEAIIERELPGRMATMLGRVLPRKESSNANKVLVDRFTQVFEKNLWGDSETVSGWGSRKDSTSVAAAISALEISKEKVDFTSINDIPCGDFNWIDKFLKNYPDVCYRGFDIVPSLIQRNKILYPDYEFEILDITSERPPPADLILSKDFFNHLTHGDVKKALANMRKSHSGYLLASNNFEFANEELPANVGNSSRHLDLCGEPFNLPVPIWRTHYMALWRFSDINVDQ